MTGFLLGAIIGFVCGATVGVFLLASVGAGIAEKKNYLPSNKSSRR